MTDDPDRSPFPGAQVGGITVMARHNDSVRHQQIKSGDCSSAALINLHVIYDADFVKGGCVLLHEGIDASDTPDSPLGLASWARLTNE